MTFLTEGVGKSSLISTFVSRYFAEVVPALMTRVRLPPDPATHCVTTLVDSQHGDAALVHMLTTRQWQEQQQHQRQSNIPNSASTNSLQAFLEASGGGVVATTNQPLPGTMNTMTTATASSANNPTAATTTSSLRASSAAPMGAADASTNTRRTATTAPEVWEGGTGMSTSTLAEQVDSIILVYDLDRVETFFRLENHWLPLLERCYQGKVRFEYIIIARRISFCSTGCHALLCDPDIILLLHCKLTFS